MTNINHGVNGISNMLNSQALLMFMGNRTRGDDNQTTGYIYMLLYTTILASTIPIILSQLGHFITFNIHTIIKKIKYYVRNPNYVEIKLSYTINTTKYGRTSTQITEDAIGLLNYIRIHIYKLKGLYSLSQESCFQRYNLEDDTTDYLPIYKINQTNKVQLWKKGKKILFVSSETTTANDENKPITKVTTITLSSVTMSLLDINNFIKLCSKEYTNFKIDDKTRYIYTHVGFNEDDSPKFRKEEFVPYSKFENIYGEYADKIKKRFDFFVSKEGMEWYKKRNLPYHMSLLLHGIPGTGKSAIAAAIASRYNLHTVRIKLSGIQTNKQFINVFKCRKLSQGSPPYKYKDLLYLFDEIDTENNDVLLDRKYHKTSTKEITSSTTTGDKCDKLKNISTTTVNDKLTLGTILEELSGINQMWGRKLIFITNFIERIDKALCRAGRMNLIVQLGKMTKDDTIKLLTNFYEIEDIREGDRRYIEDMKYTPAEIVEMCCSNKNIGDFIEHIRKGDDIVDDRELTTNIDDEFSVDI